MKKIFLIVLIVSINTFLSPGWSETLTMDELVKREKIYYKKFSDVPFSGNIQGKNQGTFINGKREGKWITFHDNGQIFIKTNFKNGLHEGNYTSYYSDGTLWVKTNMKEGKEHGLSEYFYSSEWGGRPQWKGHKKNGLREGNWVGWWDNGQLHYKGKYSNGKKEGKWLVYSDNGSLSKKHSGFFKNNIKINN